MKTIDAIRNADKITVSHAYGDDTFLYDIFVGDKVFVVRTHYLNIAKYATKRKEVI